MLDIAGHPVFITVVSSKRAYRVREVQEQLSPYRVDAWYVKPDDVHSYTEAGAGYVCGSANGAAGGRNAALDGAASHDAICVQPSDDLRRVKEWRGAGNKPEPVGLPQAIDAMVSHLVESQYKLGGASPTDNAYFVRKSHSRDLFVVGDAIAVKPDATPRFDLALTYKEDYDFTLQHMVAYGGVNRCDHLLFTFQHYTNPGGAVVHRNDRGERDCIRHLMKKWPGMVRENPRRKNEVLLVKPKRTVLQ